MRLIRIAVPDEQRDDVLDVVRDGGFGYTTTPGTGEQDDLTVVTFIVPADAVEHVLEDIERAGFDRNTYTASVETEFASFEGVDEIQNEWAKTPNKIAPATLRSKAKDLRLNTRSYLWMMVLSTVVATAGLLLSTPAIVVGSMVLAPIVSPMLTASVGAVRDDRDMVLDSLHMQGIGLGVAILGAFAFALLVKHAFAVPTTLDVTMMELITIRSTPGMLSVIVGLAAGAAGAFGLATKGQVSIVGVMVAAALIPTAAASGVGFAWDEPILGVGSLVLLVVTIFAVNLGGLLMLTYLGYRPDEVDRGFFEVGSVRETAVLVVTAVVIVAVLLPVAVGTYQQFAFERSVNAAVTDVLERGDYDDLEITAISVQFNGAGPVSNPTAVTVRLSRTSDRQYGGLPNDFHREIANRTGENVTVNVAYDVFDQSNVSTGRSATLGTAPARATA